MTGAAVEVFVPRGRLYVRGLSPLPPYVFRIDLSEFGFDSCRVAFGRDPGTEACALHLDLQPLSLHTLPDRRSPARGATGALAVGATAAAACRLRAHAR